MPTMYSYMRLLIAVSLFSAVHLIVLDAAAGSDSTLPTVPAPASYSRALAISAQVASSTLKLTGKGVLIIVRGTLRTVQIGSAIVAPASGAYCALELHKVGNLTEGGTQSMLLCAASTLALAVSSGILWELPQNK